MHFRKLAIRSGRALRRRAAAAGLVVLMLFTSLPLAAQAPAGQAPMADLPMVKSLKVLALAGNGEFNDLERRVMAPLVVQVLDENGRPVEGAQVVFRFPAQGPGVRLPDGKTSVTATSNVDGQARAAGWTANGEVGTFAIRVTATRRNEFGEATLSMTNAQSMSEAAAKSSKKSWWSTKWGRIAILAGAGAAAGIAVAATRGSGSTASGPSVVVVPGAPTVGGR